MILALLLTIVSSHSHLFKRYTAKELSALDKSPAFFAQLLKEHPPAKANVDNNQYGYFGIDIHSTEYPYKPAASEDSRSPCPFLNTMANHGILPRNGKDIPIQQLFEAVVHVGALSPFLSNVLTTFSQFLGGVDRNGTPIISLHELGLHSSTEHDAIEHDASLSRLDSRGPNGAQDSISPNEELIDQLLDFSEGGYLKLEDIMVARRVRLVQTKANPAHVKFTTKDFFVMNGETIFLAGVMGRDYKISVSDATSFLKYEKFPLYWQPRTEALGITEFSLRLAQVAWGTPEDA